MIKSVARSLVVLVALAGAFHARAAELVIMSNDGLYAGALRSVQQRDWVRAYGFLMAFIQRKPPQLDDIDFAAKVSDGLAAAEENARKVVRVASGGAGVGATYDTKGPSYRRIDLPPNLPPAPNPDHIKKKPQNPKQP